MEWLTELYVFSFSWCFSKLLQVFWAPNPNIILIHFFLKKIHIHPKIWSRREKNLPNGYFPYRMEQRKPVLHNHALRVPEQVEVGSVINESCFTAFGELGFSEYLTISFSCANRSSQVPTKVAKKSLNILCCRWRSPKTLLIDHSSMVLNVLLTFEKRVTRNRPPTWFLR